MKAPYTKEQFDQQLRRNNMTLDVLKAQIRTRLSIERLINKEITSHITITDADIAAFYNANKGSFNVAEPRVHLAQILVTPTPDPNLRNLSNTKAQNDADARRKLAAVLNAVKEHPDDFATIAQGYSEDSGSVPNGGGDLGFLPESALDKASPEIPEGNQFTPARRDFGSHPHRRRLPDYQSHLPRHARAEKVGRPVRAAGYPRHAAYP